MNTYNLKWKKNKEQGFWNTNIYAENDEEAIEKAKKYISIKNAEKASIEKIKYSYKTIKILK